MALFKRKEDEEVEEIDELEAPVKRKIKDLNPENKRARKEIVKSWGKFERLFVLITLVVTVGASGFLALSARNFRLPSFKKITIPDLSSLNPLREQVIVVGNKGNSIDQAKIEKTKEDFKEATDSYDGLYAFYIYDLNGNYYYGENHQELMQAASLIKLPVMALAYKEFENGNLNRDEYTPLLEAMGKRSDNSAFLEMLNVLGRSESQQYINSLGMTKTNIEDNSTSPEDIGLFFKKLYKNELLSEKDSNQFLSFLTDTIFENWIKPGVPDDIRVAHKYGREVHVVNDAGIVYSSRPFVMVIMTDGVIEREADELFPNLSKILYNDHVR